MSFEVAGAAGFLKHGRASHRRTPALVSRRRVIPMRGSGLIWTIVGILLIIVLVVWLMNAL